jgi:hypothetical protein
MDGRALSGDLRPVSSCHTSVGELYSELEVGSRQPLLDE